MVMQMWSELAKPCQKLVFLKITSFWPEFAIILYRLAEPALSAPSAPYWNWVQANDKSNLSLAWSQGKIVSKLFPGAKITLSECLQSCSAGVVGHQSKIKKDIL
jgi:hypothetical protein